MKADIVLKQNFLTTEGVNFHLYQEKYIVTGENWINIIDSAFPLEIHALIFKI